MLLPVWKEAMLLLHDAYTFPFLNPSRYTVSLLVVLSHLPTFSRVSYSAASPHVHIIRHSGFPVIASEFVVPEKLYQVWRPWERPPLFFSGRTGLPTISQPLSVPVTHLLFCSDKGCSWQSAQLLQSTCPLPSLWICFMGSCILKEESNSSSKLAMSA